MPDLDIQWQQLLIAKLAQRWPDGYIGRTQLMKACYFLQVVRGVPLPYRFTLYSYGPFDKNLLFDLGVAGNLGLVREKCAIHGTGYSYQIRTEIEPAHLDSLGGEALKNHEADIAWVVDEFGARSASQLELDATIVYADRESEADGREETVESLATTVSNVKPRFDYGTIVAAVNEMLGKGLLKAITPALPS